MFRRKHHSFNQIKNRDIDPDEVFLDAFNLPSFDTNQFEGRVERSLRGGVPTLVGAFCFLVFSVFLFQTWNLQVARGEAMVVLSEKNNLDHDIIFAQRGVIYDRLGRELVWNVPPVDAEGLPLPDTYAFRHYYEGNGFAHLLGFVGYPEKDSSGHWWRTDYVGRAGVEQSLNNHLEGENGVRIIEVDALNNVQSENTIRTPIDGDTVTLSIDADIQEALYQALKEGAQKSGFVGGAGVIMDVETGEIIALTNYPEYSSQVMTDATQSDVIAGYSTNGGQPFLNRAVLGEYTPGSIVKPYVASAALAEKIIAPTKAILSTGEIRIPNPYNPGNSSIFRDWKAHGWVTMRDALAVSSNVYFYAVGGGYQDQVGLGIERLAKYANAFGFGEPTGIEFDTEAHGVVPTPEWKEQEFGVDDPWRIGNTYHTSIGQFGFLVTPIQAVRYISAIANGGSLLKPHLTKDSISERVSVGVADSDLQIVREGMQQAAQEGSAIAVNVPGIRIAGKTGTAQLGSRNEHMNSWVVGYWPTDKPKFAYAAVLEKAPAGTLRGAAPALQSFFRYLVNEQPEYTQGQYPEAVTPEEGAE